MLFDFHRNPHSITKSRSTWSERTDTYRWMDRFSGRYRNAMVAGSIVVDGVDLIEGIDLRGDLFEQKSGTVSFGTPWYW